MNIKTEKLTEGIEKHDTLNPDLWDENNELRPEVRSKLEDIVKHFDAALKSDGVELDILDVVIIGSNASYNYNDASDIDLHVIADTSVYSDEDLALKIYLAYKSLFNNKYDPMIRNHEVEIYVEPYEVHANSKGIYSLNNGWLKEPENEDIPEIEQSEVEDYLAPFKERYEEVIENGSVEDVDKLIDDIYLERQTSIIKDGEFAIPNLAFKEFRAQGYLQNLRDRKVELENEAMSIDENDKVKESVLNLFVDDDSFCNNLKESLLITDLNAGDILSNGRDEIEIIEINDDNILYNYKPLNSNRYTATDPIESFIHMINNFNFNKQLKEELEEVGNGIEFRFPEVEDTLKVFLDWEGVYGYNDDILEYADTTEEDLASFLEYEGIFGLTGDIWNILKGGKTYVPISDVDEFYKFCYECGVNPTHANLYDGDFNDGETITEDVDEIKNVSIEFINKIIDEREPRGLFLANEGDHWIAVDNLTGDAWTEAFKTKDGAIRYLQNRDLDTYDWNDDPDWITEAVGNTISDADVTFAVTKIVNDAKRDNLDPAKVLTSELRDGKLKDFDSLTIKDREYLRGHNGGWRVHDVNTKKLIYSVPREAGPRGVALDIVKDILNESLNEKIVKKGSKYQVQSEKGRNMGTYGTKKEAENRLKEVEMFKHMNEDDNRKIQARIATTDEFDNGKVFFKYDLMTTSDAEEKAKNASIKFPNRIFYVKYDDVMNPSSNLKWVNGKSYTSYDDALKASKLNEGIKGLGLYDEFYEPTEGGLIKVLSLSGDGDVEYLVQPGDGSATFKDKSSVDNLINELDKYGYKLCEDVDQFEDDHDWLVKLGKDHLNRLIGDRDTGSREVRPGINWTWFWTDNKKDAIRWFKQLTGVLPYESTLVEDDKNWGFRLQNEFVNILTDLKDDGEDWLNGNKPEYWNDDYVLPEELNESYLNNSDEYVIDKLKNDLLYNYKIKPADIVKKGDNFLIVFFTKEDKEKVMNRPDMLSPVMINGELGYPYRFASIDINAMRKANNPKYDRIIRGYDEYTLQKKYNDFTIHSIDDVAEDELDESFNGIDIKDYVLIRLPNRELHQIKNNPTYSIEKVLPNSNGVHSCFTWGRFGEHTVERSYNYVVATSNDKDELEKLKLKLESDEQLDESQDKFIYSIDDIKDEFQKMIDKHPEWTKDKAIEFAGDVLLDKGVSYKDLNRALKEFKDDIKESISSASDWVQEVSLLELNDIIEDRSPRGLFLSKDGDKYIAVDNSSYDAWTEEFDNKDDAISFLMKESLNEEIDEDDERGKALADYLGLGLNELDYIGSDRYETEGQGSIYFVVTKDEAKHYAKETIKYIVFDAGIDSFTKDFQKFIYNKCVNEDDVDEFINNEIEYFSSIEDEQDMVDYLKGLNTSEKVQYIIDTLGKDDFNDWLFLGPSKIDFDKLADEAIKLDGIAHFLADYDHKEIDLGKGLYAYRAY